MLAGKLHITRISPAIAMPMPSVRPDHSLLDRCASGDVFAFRELYEQWKTPLYTLAYRFHGNREDAEDSLQEAFVNMYRGIAGFRKDAKLSSWMYRVLLNACISSKRPRRSSEKGVDFRHEHAHPQTPEHTGDVVLRDVLEAEIAQLPAMQKAVFLLHASQELTHGEIAEVLRISVGTSKSSYHRARNALKERLARRGIHDLEVET
jgi:RNA polymerase sigma-70 factor (ECF subfamily)